MTTPISTAATQKSLRFGKLKVARHLQTQYQFAVRSFGKEVGRRYDPVTGWNQVDGLGEVANRIYAQIDQLERLYESLGLDTTGEEIS